MYVKNIIPIRMMFTNVTDAIVSIEITWTPGLCQIIKCEIVIHEAPDIVVRILPDPVIY